jgi:K(+)-stimulated pyrophosphate-energized sodium pump
MNQSMGFFSAPAPCLQDINPMNLMENAFRRILPIMLATVMALLAPPMHGHSLIAQVIQPGAQPIAAPVQQPHAAGGEANLIIPDLSQVDFFGVHGTTLLKGGLLVCALGLVFGLVIYMQLKNMAVHQSMLDISELIYETCKTYLITQGKFILLLEVFIGAVIALYFGVLQHFTAMKVIIILVFSLIGIAGSYGVAWFGIRVNTFANSRTAFAALRGKPYPCYAIPLSAGMSIGMLLISVELVLMLSILLFVPGDYAGACFIGFAIGESLGAAALRIAGGIFTKIADIGADLMKIVFNVKEDDARNPGVIADCTGDNAGDSVGPSADGFETYGVTGVALISFIVLAVREPKVQVQLLVWIFAMRIMMVVASGVSYLINFAIAKARYETVEKMNFEAPLTFLVWLTSILSVVLTYIVSYLMIPDLGDGTLWWKLSSVITCGTLAGAIIPELVKVFTSTESRHVKEVVTSSREGGPSLNILSGLVAGNFSAYWLGITIMGLMAVAYLISNMGLSMLMVAPAVFAFGLVAFGFLGMGPVTIAVDSYGPVTDNAQSVFELSTIEQMPNAAAEIKSTYGFTVNFEKAKHFLEENDGAHRHRGGGRHDDDLLDHRCVDERAHDQPREPLDPARAIPARTPDGRVDHLLVHGRFDPGGDDRCVPRRGVHQGEHEPREHGRCVDGGFEEGRRDLHQVCAEGHVEHLLHGVLLHAGVCVRRAVLLHRLPHLDRIVRPVSGHLHGQRRRRLG